MDDFVDELEDDILYEEQLNDMIKEVPPEPKKVKKQYTEQTNKPYTAQQKKQKVKQLVQNGDDDDEYYMPRTTRNVKQNNMEYATQMPTQLPMQMPTQVPVVQTNNPYSLNKLKEMINLNKIKLPIFTILLFFVLSLPLINNIISNYVPIMKNELDGSPTIINILIRSVFFGLTVLVFSQLI